MSTNTDPTLNPVGLEGLEFIEYASPAPEKLEQLFEKLGLTKVAQHKTKNVVLYRQRGINFIVNREPSSFAEEFQAQHGPSICATGFRVKDAQFAKEEAVRRGACPCDKPGHSFPAVYGIGDSLIYFIEDYANENIYDRDFNFLTDKKQPGLQLMTVDHMTNNVPAGQMDQWCNFYRDIFNFREVRYFDIKGSQTGLVSKVMKSPCNRIIIPINEPSDNKSQIQEYIEEYKGSGIQHIALITPDICKAVESLRERGIEFLDTPDTYYEAIPSRLPNVTEDLETLKKFRILVDGDEKGYLLQIFTKNLIGPIFYEIIQRKNHDGFGEGNFQALFDSIEEDQRRRGYL